MKFAVTCLLLLVAVALAQAYPSMLRERRGFRAGAADRFSHGFGKRTQDLMTVKDVANILTENENAAVAFVQRYLDLNGDGYITPDELVKKDEK